MIDHEKTVSCLSIRSAYDVLAEILGDGARTVVLRGAHLDRIIDNPPPYSWDPEFTNREQAEIFWEIVKLVGVPSAQSIIRRIGYRGIEAMVVKSGIIDSLKPLPKQERFARAVGLFRGAINKGRVVDSAIGLAAMDVFDCLMCEGITSERPYCSHYVGCIQLLADWTFGAGRYLVRETRCKAMGDDTCFFELEEG